jgi:hypothetical protein
VRRGPAGRLIRDSKLKPSEKLIMLALLERADNDTCAIPAWRSPSLRALEEDTSLSHRAVIRGVAHLELHGWLERTGQRRGQLPGTKHSGHGRSATRWALLPLDYGPAACACARPDRATSIQSDSKIVPEVSNLDWIPASAVPAGEEPRCTKGGREEGEGRWMGQPGGFFDAEANGY